MGHRKSSTARWALGVLALLSSGFGPIHLPPGLDHEVRSTLLATAVLTGELRVQESQVPTEEVPTEETPTEIALRVVATPIASGPPPMLAV